MNHELYDLITSTYSQLFILWAEILNFMQSKWDRELDLHYDQY